MQASNFEASLLAAQPALRSAARKLCTNQANPEDSANDLLQDSNVRVLERRDQFVGGSLVGWAYRVMLNLLRDHFRKRGREREVMILRADMARVGDSDDFDDDWVPAYDDACDTHDSHAKLEATQTIEKINLMPDRTAAALLQAGVGATCPEIAASLALSEANVRQLLARGRLELRLMLQTNEHHSLTGNKANAAR